MYFEKGEKISGFSYSDVVVTTADRQKRDTLPRHHSILASALQRSDGLPVSRGLLKSWKRRTLNRGQILKDLPSHSHRGYRTFQLQCCQSKPTLCQSATNIGTNQRVAVFNHCATVNGRHHPFCVSCFWQPEGPIQLTLSGFSFYELELSQILDRPGNQTVLHRAKLVVTPSGKACHASGVQPRDVTKHAISNLCVAISVELQL